MQVEVSKISVLDLIKKIQNIKSLDDLADFIGSETKYISYYLYKCPDEKKYKVHQIPKKKGGFREISSPANGLKIIQRNLNSVLLKIYDEFITKSVHGFVLKKSIVSNASKHIHRRFLLNIDLKDFFPSVHFGRIKGLFQHEPFNLNDFSSTSLANLCCFKGVLPQGAPTSPILTNFVCYKLDKQLIKLATENKCKYTRYADDITFSTNLKEFPLDVASLKFKEKDNKSMFENLYMKIDSILKIEKFKFSSQINGNTKDEISIEFKDNLCSEKIKVLKNLIFKSNCKMKQTSSNCILISNNIAETEVDLSDKFINIIASNGFQVNFNKVRMQTREYKQEVTGIKVNTKPNVERTYIRNIRAMLNCWSKFGLNKAQEIFFTKKATFKHPNKHQVNFQNVLFGRIDFVGQVRGKDDSIYLKLLKQYKVLNGEYVDEDKNENLEELRKSIIEECVHLISQNTEVIEKSFQLNKTQIENILDRLRFKVKLSKTSIKILAKHINQLKKVGNDRVTISDDEIDISSETINRIRLDIKTLFDLIKQNDIKFQKFDRELKDIKNEIDYNVETSINVTRIKDEVLKNRLLIDNKKMVRAEIYKDDYFEFCRWFIIQIEGIIGYINDKVLSFQQRIDIFEINKGNYFKPKNGYDENDENKNNYNNNFFNHKLIVLIEYLLIDKFNIKENYYHFIQNSHHLRNIPSHGDYASNKWWVQINEKSREYAKKHYEVRNYQKAKVILQKLIDSLSLKLF